MSGLRPGRRDRGGDWGGDRGSVLVLGLGMVAVALLVVMVGVDATSAYLQRRSLVALADASALAGAQAIDAHAYYRDGATSTTGLDPAAVTGRVSDFLRAVVADAPEGLRLEAVATDGRVVVVRLSQPLRLPFLSAMVRDPITVESRARLAYRTVDVE